MLTLLASFAQEEIRSLSDNVKWGTRKRFEKGIPNGRFQIYGYRWEGDHLVVHEEEAKIVRLIYDNYMNGLSAETTEKQLAEMAARGVKGFLSAELNAGQMVEDVRLAVNGKAPVEHYGRQGGMMFNPDEVLDALKEKLIKK